MIFYFTGTGNSFALAKQWQELTGEDMVFMGDALKQKELSYETKDLVLVFPVHYYGPPRLVEEFLRKATFRGVERTLALLNFGSTPGIAKEKLRELLKQQGLSLDHCFYIPMPENYTIMFWAPGEEKEKNIRQTAEEKIRRIHKDREKEEKHEKEPGFLLGKGIYTLTRWMYRRGRNTKKFYANARCIGCGRCEKICPISAIQMEGGKPAWIKPRCEDCMACINSCPVDAIQYGFLGLRTRWKRRYIHPKYQKYLKEKNFRP